MAILRLAFGHPKNQIQSSFGRNFRLECADWNALIGALNARAGMKADLVADFQSLPPQLKFAGALTFAALALMALDAGLTGLSPSEPPRTAPTRVEAPPPAGLRNLAYYPEQLAALTSMADFEPRADSGAAAIPAAEPAAPVARKPIRRVAATAPVRVPPPTGAPAAPPTPEAESPVRILGLSLPQPSAIGARVVAIRESASHLGEAARDLGGRIATFWR